MPNLGPAEIAVIFVVALLVFGPKKLPEIGRQIGRAARELRRMQVSLRDEMKEAFEPPPTTPETRALKENLEHTTPGDDPGGEQPAPASDEPTT